MKKAQYVWQKRKVAEARAAGKCWWCWKRPAEGGKLSCEICRSKHRLRRNRYDKLTLARRRKTMHDLVLDKYGGRCASLGCRWLNSDGTFGCNDRRVLQIDHVFGGGTKQTRKLGYDAFHRLVLADTEGNFQLLCPTCNWIKRVETNEAPNARRSRMSFPHKTGEQPSENLSVDLLAWFGRLKEMQPKLNAN